MLRIEIGSQRLEYYITMILWNVATCQLALALSLFLSLSLALALSLPVPLARTHLFACALVHLSALATEAHRTPIGRCGAFACCLYALLLVTQEKWAGPVLIAADRGAAGRILAWMRRGCWGRENSRQSWVFYWNAIGTLTWLIALLLFQTIRILWYHCNEAIKQHSRSCSILSVDHLLHPNATFSPAQSNRPLTVIPVVQISNHPWLSRLVKVRNRFLLGLV